MLRNGIGLAHFSVYISPRFLCAVSLNCTASSADFPLCSGSCFCIIRGVTSYWVATSTIEIYGHIQFLWWQPHLYNTSNEKPGRGSIFNFGFETRGPYFWSAIRPCDSSSMGKKILATVGTQELNGTSQKISTRKGWTGCTYSDFKVYVAIGIHTKPYINY